MPSTEPRDTPKQWLKAIAIWTFLGFWIYFFSFSLYASGCHKFSRPADERLHKCENSLRFTGFLFTDHQRATNLINQGIAQADLGEDAKAIALFTKAIPLLTGASSSNRRPLKLRIEILDRKMRDPAILPRARDLFQTAVSEWVKSRS
ncbi:hypothetical protein [Phaeobacter italicus]|uniref:hypothetical protein n=1 Tax=Phaeobacter italicus TaxID=481446 RepID=UPI00055F9DAC|nr:hypothetical protein [Phaeobacter italicus]CRL15665.1 hypothetical protein NIT7645_02717 [Phaeobacter italicus]SFG43881.1 hypothetical protein SAMN04488019_10224 [Phaeobacter italicus]